MQKAPTNMAELLGGLQELDTPVLGSPEYFAARRKNFWSTHHIGLQELDTPVLGSPEYYAAKRNNFWTTHHIGLQELLGLL